MHTKCRSLLAANLLGQMDSCISSKGGRQAWGIPEKFRFFMEGQMMPLAVSGRGKKNQKGNFLRDWLPSELPPHQLQDSSHFLDEETGLVTIQQPQGRGSVGPRFLTRAQHKVTSKRHLLNNEIQERGSVVVVAVIVKKMVNKSLYCCCLLLLGPQGAQKQVTLQQEGVGLSGSPDGGPERASGCPKVTQTGPTGANRSPQHSSWPKNWGFPLLPLGDDFAIVTVATEGLPGWDTSWEWGWSQALMLGGARGQLSILGLPGGTGSGHYPLVWM